MKNKGSNKYYIKEYPIWKWCEVLVPNPSKTEIDAFYNVMKYDIYTIIKN